VSPWRIAQWIFAVIFVLAVLQLVAGCDEPRCKDGDQNIQGTGDVFLCVDGKWVRQDNPNTEPIEALGEQGLGIG